MRKHLYTLGFLASAALLSGCSAKISDAFQKALDIFALNKQTTMVLVSNTTTQGQAQCMQGNEVVIRKSVPAGRLLYCREKSKISETLKLGEVCPGGAVVNALEVSDKSIPCKELTLCGLRASSLQVIGKRESGGTIEELKFSNLPWGCNAELEFSFDPSFADETINKLEFYVQPPECPFCPRQNRATCLPCSDLSQNEEIKAGQVVKRACVGGVCASCEVLHKTGEFIAHGQGKVYYKTQGSSCDLKCNQQSLLRYCNDGLWQGDPKYEFPQCNDSVCGCTLPGETISYVHHASTDVFNFSDPACGLNCNGLSITCNDGKWETGTPAQVLSIEELQKYPAHTCTKRVCHCVRPGRDVVADGQSKPVYSKPLVSCTERCLDFAGAVTCAAGSLSSVNASYLNYSADSCEQEDCGCRIPLDDGSSLLLANGGVTTLHQFSQNSLAVPDACTNSAYQIQVSCANKVLTPVYDAGIFKYKNCIINKLSCTFTDGAGQKVEVAHLAKLNVSKTSTPACGEACVNLQLTCEDRVFKKRVGSTLVAVTNTELAQYTSASSCTAKNCDCNVNGNIIKFGQSNPNFYTTDKVTNCNLNGCDDAKATLSCSIAGASSSKGDSPSLYKYKSCEMIPCGCSVPWGGTIDNGRTIRIFSLDKADCAAPTACQETGNSALVTCTNGKLSSYDTTRYIFPTCKPSVCNCDYLGVKTPFGKTLKVFQSDPAPVGTICNSISAVITCQEGGTWTGAELTKYPSVTCTDQTDDGEGGGTGGGGGNDEGPGFGIKRRTGLRDGGGDGICLSFSKCRMNKINVNIAPFQKLSCILPWGGGEVEFYGSVSAFNSRCVVGPDKCSKHRIMRTCHFQKWTGDDEYAFPSCEEKEACP